MRLSLVIILLLPLFLLAQKKQITLEDIFKNQTFREENVGGFSTLKPDSLFNKSDIKNDKGTLINTNKCKVSGTKKYILFFDETESIYRHSSKSVVYLYTIETKKIIRLNEGRILYPTFSPDESKISYVFENNLYLYDIAADAITAVTHDGKWNKIINGNCDWVYEEEFGFSQAYEWSPKGNYIAYYRFDESKVKEYEITMFNDQYNKQYSYKYPKAGEENSTIEIHIYDVATGNDVKADFEQGDIYIPRIKWTQEDNKLVVYHLNRHQDHLQLLLTDAATGTSSLLYDETNKYYVDINDNWRFLKDGSAFLFTSEMNGYDQLYLYSMDGKKKIQLHKTNYDIAEINAVDENKKLVYYTLAYPTALDRNLFVTGFDGLKTTQLTTGSGWHKIEMNDSLNRFYDYYSDINTPKTTTLFNLVFSKKEIAAVKDKVVGENAALKTLLTNYDMETVSIIRVPNSKGDTLNGWMLKPSNFDPNQKYPVLFCNYGGPGSQQVTNRYGAVSYWHRLLAANGFIVVSIDNTGTGYRGEEFKKKTYLQLGKLEIEDQVDAAKYLGTLSYIDKNRIGHWGWSYGGFMSSLAITKGADVFKAAVAVAPVTSWRFYDNIYTERYMRTPAENTRGYDDNSPLNFVDKIKGKFLIIHGTGDDNVHFQNSVEMVEAMIQKNIVFESGYYPNRNHGISGGNTSFHLWSKMTSWLIDNLKNNTAPISAK